MASLSHCVLFILVLSSNCLVSGTKLFDLLLQQFQSLLFFGVPKVRKKHNLYHLSVHSSIVYCKRCNITTLPLLLNIIFLFGKAMYGFLPSGLDTSFKKYFIYNLIPLEIDIDPKTKDLVKITRSYVIQNILQFLLGFAKVSILLSVLSSRDFIPFQVPSSFTLVTAFHPGRIMNHAIAGILFEQVLSVFAAGLSLLFAFLTGVQIVELMKSAMFSSKSPVS